MGFFCTFVNLCSLSFVLFSTSSSFYLLSFAIIVCGTNKLEGREMPEPDYEKPNPGLVRLFIRYLNNYLSSKLRGFFVCFSICASSVY